MLNRISVAAIVAAGVVASAASAEFFVGQPVAINGSASGGVGATTWGTHADQGVHQLGGQSTFFDSVFGSQYPVFVTSSVVNPFSVVFSIDFSLFFPGDFAVHSIEIIGLKSDGSISGIESLTGGFSTDGNNVFWTGTGAELAAIQKLSFKVFQVPAPGAFALLGLAGISGTRRRRA